MHKMKENQAKSFNSLKMLGNKEHHHNMVEFSDHKMNNKPRLINQFDAIHVMPTS